MNQIKLFSNYSSIHELEDEMQFYFRLNDEITSQRLVPGKWETLSCEYLHESFIITTSATLHQPLHQTLFCITFDPV